MSASFGRVWGLVFVGLLSGQAMADRLVNVPTARPLSKNAVRFEYLAGLNNTGAQEQFMAVSVLNGLEFELRRRIRPEENGRTTFDLGYNILSPVASTAPGISVGLLDGLDETVDGRRAFIALTFRELLEVGEVGENGDVTIGVQSGSMNSVFFGFSLPFSGRTRLIVEDNGARVTAGIETNFLKGLDAKLYVQDKLLLGGVSFSRRF